MTYLYLVTFTHILKQQMNTYHEYMAPEMFPMGYRGEKFWADFMGGADSSYSVPDPGRSERTKVSSAFSSRWKRTVPLLMRSKPRNKISALSQKAVLLLPLSHTRSPHKNGEDLQNDHGAFPSSPFTVLLEDYELRTYVSTRARIPTWVRWAGLETPKLHQSNS